MQKNKWIVWPHLGIMILYLSFLCPSGIKAQNAALKRKVNSETGDALPDVTIIFNITLLPDAKTLEEIVVVGYWNTKEGYINWFRGKHLY